MVTRRYDEDVLIKTIEQSSSVRDVLLRLGLKATTGNYRVFYRFVKRHNIDISALSRNNAARAYTPKVDISLYLNNVKPITAYKLRQRLVEAGLKQNKCECCGIDSWLGKELKCQLHHIDGNPNNNNLCNLQMLCPNCHTQTDNFSGKNKRTKL